MTDDGCIHLRNFKAAVGTENYRVIHSYFIACTSTEARIRKACTCMCFSCGKVGPRLHSCLHCIYFGCAGAHIGEHTRIKKHYLSVELSYGYIYCSQCQDYVYDKELLDIAEENKIKQARSLRMAVEWNNWMPSAIDCELLRMHPRRRRVTQQSSIGLRGIVNLGSTCFMSCIVQALIHTPLLRDYFLAERHECKGSPQNGKCLVCELAHLFQEFYSGSRGSLIIHRLLHMIWTHAHHLAGYEQQDAHEFFIATLDVLHLHCKSAMPPVLSLPSLMSIDTSSTGSNSSGSSSIGGNPNHCRCIIDQIFTGSLQSDLVCQKCGCVSTTIDPFWDISLELGGGGIPPRSLLDCLERFTQAEHLGSSVKIKCANCNDYQESTKQLTMKTLPIVASFHLKRFEVFDKINKKISTFISFPIELDMTPFISPCRNVASPDNTPASSNVDHRYLLFAVINHEGSLKTGHYIAYIKHHKDFWVKCDDQVLTRVTISEVLKSEGYLLFYHKKILEYE